MERERIRVMGVDPGSRVTGIGILDVAPGRAPALVDSGAVELGSSRDLPERLADLHESLERTIERHRPSVLVVETVFHGKSFQSALKVGEVRGVVLLAGALRGLEVEQFTPAMVKKTATGNGRASKPQVQRMICRLLGLPRPPEPADVADALAIAFCYSQRLWRRRLLERCPAPGPVVASGGSLGRSGSPPLSTTSSESSESSSSSSLRSPGEEGTNRHGRTHLG